METGDWLTLEMPMPWRLVRGHKMQEGRVALTRGSVLYCIGTAGNGGLIRKHPEPGDHVLDPESLGEPVADDSIRPNGLKALARAWPREGQGSPELGIVFTEFVDPTGGATYFRVPDRSDTVEDELTGEVLTIGQ